MSPIVVPTGSTPTLSEMLSRVRLDLFDAGERAGDQPRWTDADLFRALDRSTDAYSRVAPYLKESLLPTTAGMRLYAVPDGAWWIDAAEYPYGLWPKWWQPVTEKLSPLIQPPPDSDAAPELSAGGSLSVGAYRWQVTFVVPGGGETTAAVVASGTVGLGQQATIPIPVGPYGVSARNIYRTSVNGSTFTFAGSVADNSSTSFTDGAADADIASGAPPPVANATQGIRQFEVQIPDGQLPGPDTAGGGDPNWGWIGLRCATKHQLDGNGTTIPERHWDALTLGTVFFAVFAYLIPTADNFHYVDGQFRDQVDDTNVPTAWLQMGKELESQLRRRLDEIRDEVNAGVAAISFWGDKPVKWDRL